MGEPAVPSPADRASTRALAATVVEAVRNDKAMPLPGVVDCYARSASVEREGVESLVMQLCQEIAALTSERLTAVQVLAKVTHGGYVTSADWGVIASLLKETGVEP